MDVLAVFLLIILITLVLVLRRSLFDRLDRLEREIARLRQSPSGQAPPPAVSARPGEGEHLKPGMPTVVPSPAAPAESGTGITAPVESKHSGLVTGSAAPAEGEHLKSGTRPAAPVESEPFRPVTRSTAGVAPGYMQEGVQPGSTGQSMDVKREGMRAGDVKKAVMSTEEKKGFFERHPDLEKFIGENLVSKIGIAILVLAIGFFVKYAIDNDWIGPVGRVGIGVLCGGVLIGLAHWLRKNYSAFSSVLVGGGLAVLYFTIALAYHEYQLFGQTMAFIIMLVITAFSVVLSLLYNRQELAVIALVGGFVTPFLVSNGRGNYQVLFSYLLILNTGLLVIAYNKAWRLLNILAFLFTAVLFASWILSLPYDVPLATYRGGLWFATAFYLLFFAINTAYTVKENKQFIASDFGILLTNTCLYAGAVLYMFTQLGLHQYKGWYCAGMGVFHLATSWFLFRKNRVDKNILYLFIGITMSFVSLAAPLQLHGHYITLFWASEAVLLYWLFLKSQIKLIRLAAIIVWSAMLISLGMDWFSGYALSEHLPIVFNKAFLTGLYAVISSWALFWLGKWNLWSRIALITGGVLLLLAGLLEIGFQVNHLYYEIYSQLYLWLLVVGFTYFLYRQKEEHFGFLKFWLPAAGIVIYLICLPEIFLVQRHVLEGGLAVGVFTGHWIGVVLVTGILGLLIKKRPLVPQELFMWLVCLVTVIIVSAEGQMLVNMLYFSPKRSLEEIERVYVKTGLPILWGLCSFAFMWLGMRKKNKTLRVISLVLFSITLLKLFLFDIQNIPIAGKIAAFFCLGVLLLVVSFMYQRLKKIIIEDEEKKTV